MNKSLKPLRGLLACALILSSFATLAVQIPQAQAAEDRPNVTFAMSNSDTNNPVYPTLCKGPYGNGSHKLWNAVPTGTTSGTGSSQIPTITDSMTGNINLDCIKLQVLNPSATYTSDFRFCLYIINTKDNLGFPANSSCTPWASEGGGSGQQLRNPSGKIVYISIVMEHRNAPPNTVFSNVGIGAQLFFASSGGSCGGSSGPVYASANPGSVNNEGEANKSNWGYSQNGDDDPGCAQAHMQVTAESSTPSGLPQLELTKNQSTVTYPITNDAVGVWNVQNDPNAPSMRYTGSSVGSFIQSISTELQSDNGSPIPSGQIRVGSFTLRQPQSLNIGTHNGSITIQCNPLASCESGFTSRTLGIQYIIPGPSVSLNASTLGPISAGTPVTLTWNSSNTNANQPVSSSNFGASSASGSIVVNPGATTTYFITVKGLSDIDNSPANFNTAQVTVTVSGGPSPQPPEANDVSNFSDFCSVGHTKAVITWRYSDPNDQPPGTDPQTAYQVQIDVIGSSFTNPPIDSGQQTGSQTSYSADWSGTNLVGKSVRSRVRVWDSQGLVSAWELSPVWQTPAHAYPQVDFCWSGSTSSDCNPPISGPIPKVGAPIQFSDRTGYFDGTNGSQGSWLWNFGDNTTSTLRNPTHTYSTILPYAVTLTANDRDGYSCTISKPINIRRPVPIWKEVAPGS